MRMSNNNQTALTNVEIFTDVVKDRICDWIYYHHCQPDRDLVDIRDLVFTKKVSGRAYATYLDNKYCGQYLFIVSFDNDKKGVYLDVIDNSVERYAQLTFQWNGLTCLGFDKKGYSYELTTKEYNYLENEKMKEIDDQVLLIVKYVRELKQAEDVGDWDKVIGLSDAIQDSGHNIGKAADEINVAIKKGMHIG